MSTYSETKSLHTFTSKMFDFRLLFLLTALCPEQRAVARHNHAAVETQLKVIRDIIEDGEESVSQESALVICEVLKVWEYIYYSSRLTDNATVKLKVEGWEYLVVLSLTMRF